MTGEITKDTQLCISIASRPSNFGTTLHNAAYRELSLDFIYKAFQVSDVAGAIAGVRALNIRGCSVSMPFKETVIAYLDEMDETAKVIGAVNTVVNEKGRLIGYNTDAIGALKALQSIQASPKDSVLLLGAGGVARAIAFALKKLGFTQIQVANRKKERIQELQNIISCTPVDWEHRNQTPASLLINATSIGMNPHPDESPWEASALRQARAAMDVVVYPFETRLLQSAKEAGLQVAPGFLMSLEQAMAQFTLYTGRPAPRQVMEQTLQLMK